MTIEEQVAGLITSVAALSADVSTIKAAVTAPQTGGTSLQPVLDAIAASQTAVVEKLTQVVNDLEQ